MVSYIDLIEKPQYNDSDRYDLYITWFYEPPYENWQYYTNTVIPKEVTNIILYYPPWCEYESFLEKINISPSLRSITILDRMPMTTKIPETINISPFDIRNPDSLIITFKRNTLENDVTEGITSNSTVTLAATIQKLNLYKGQLIRIGKRDGEYFISSNGKRIHHSLLKPFRYVTPHEIPKPYSELFENVYIDDTILYQNDFYHLGKNIFIIKNG